jgi:hypothetical protein
MYLQKYREVRTDGAVWLNCVSTYVFRWITWVNTVGVMFRRHQFMTIWIVAMIVL